MDSFETCIRQTEKITSPPATFRFFFRLPVHAHTPQLGMSGISLSPKRALAYPGTRLTFVDEGSVAYCFGSAVRITHVLPDKV